MTESDDLGCLVSLVLVIDSGAIHGSDVLW